MEISEDDVQVGNQPTDLISAYDKRKNDEPEADLNEVEIITSAQHFCAIEIGEEAKNYDGKAIDKEDQSEANESNASESSALGNIQHAENGGIANVLTDPIYLDTLDSDSINIEFQKQPSATEVFIRGDEQIQTTNYNISTVTISNELLDGLNINIKKEDDDDHGTLYTAEWLCDGNNDANIRLRILKDAKQNIQIPVDVDASDVIALAKRKAQLTEGKDSLEQERTKVSRRSKKHVRLKSAAVHHQDYRERLRKKAECMREKRKKLYEQESEEQRLQRLAKEAAKRREMRMYYETPEQRRKRLDAEAARKREYRMYNETPEDRRKRLDREAERRRIKRLSLYANETPEQRRDRLNKESAKRREARLSQYAKETEDERKERLRRDALRAREMRFTRSAIETEEERRQR
ncbi:PREDICTED: trichohyalin-like isoform X2 [Wasmannia auropunctata]|nr:PREDICTED: trichohyalin-like isoform X2 [Wasmannia auropunctata]